MSAVIFVRWPIPQVCTQCGQPFTDGKSVAIHGGGSGSPAVLHTGPGTNCLRPYMGQGEWPRDRVQDGGERE